MVLCEVGCYSIYALLPLSLFCGTRPSYHWDWLRLTVFYRAREVEKRHTFNQQSLLFSNYHLFVMNWSTFWPARPSLYSKRWPSVLHQLYSFQLTLWIFSIIFVFWLEQVFSWGWACDRRWFQIILVFWWAIVTYFYVHEGWITYASWWCRSC